MIERQAHELAEFLLAQPTHPEHLRAAALLKTLATVYRAADQLAKAKTAAQSQSAYADLIHHVKEAKHENADTAPRV